MAIEAEYVIRALVRDAIALAERAVPHLHIEFSIEVRGSRDQAGILKEPRFVCRLDRLTTPLPIVRAVQKDRTDTHATCHAIVAEMLVPFAELPLCPLTHGEGPGWCGRRSKKPFRYKACDFART